MLGLWSYSSLEVDLRQLINSKIPKVFNSSAAADAERRQADINAEIIKLEGHLAADQSDLSSTEIELGEKETELNEVEEELRALGAVDPEVLADSTHRRNEAAETRSRIEERLSEAWETAIPMGLFGAKRAELSEALTREERRREWEGSRAAVEPKIPKVKSDVFENVAAEFELSSDIYSFYTNRLERALQSLFNPPPDGMADAVYIVDRNDVSAMIRQQLTKNSGSLNELTELCRQAEQIDAEVRELDQKIRSLQQNAAAISRGAELYQRRGELLTELNSLRGRADDVRSNLQRNQDRLAELKREETNHAAVLAKASEGRTLVGLAHKYREAVAEIRHRAADKLRSRIAEHVGEIWINIANREEEFVGMDYDLHWNCFLKRRNGSRVPWDEINTSAGQRQVRILAFYEALRRLARHVPPLVVDTPLGRLDKGVRANVLDQLYLSGHQSIILSTDSEIDSDSAAFDAIESRIARVYTLHPHGNPASQDYQVEITEDYFGRTV